MLAATRTARQLFQSLFSVRRMGNSASNIVSPQAALPGRKEAIAVAAKHHVNGNRTVEPFPEGTQMALFGMGCFWGAERKFWTLKGVYSTQVGYAGGYTPNPTYKEVCSGRTGHAEVVRVVYQPERISFEELLKVFWENHDPTQGLRQGNDHGSQYRSAIYPTSAEHMETSLRSKEDYQKVLSEHGFGLITTDIREGQTFYYAEDYHQQYLSKIPNGYCGLGGTGVSCPLGAKEMENERSCARYLLVREEENRPSVSEILGIPPPLWKDAPSKPLERPQAEVGDLPLSPRGTTGL
ncbi:mitochondrial peptide methionine sulfoxide reductase isoform X1 [Balaenoptera acutorostrata]|uniref:peptide-methionine (S)-S-oxide reductase n=3 Tax=Balaenoptera acutorostrata TaxID=9767 RepID=A0A384AZC4_BALAC|nr:mitochondrial peptide methionine sulfoxide reductase isoform X1 [Balaenoptera acutorostrata]XP_007192757.2 mitochondrial peptide methionine sulfoxide reductase isoform X1 [Balaenoptera acutorostrata]